MRQFEFPVPLLRGKFRKTNRLSWLLTREREKKVTKEIEVEIGDFSKWRKYNFFLNLDSNASSLLRPQFFTDLWFRQLSITFHSSPRFSYSTREQPPPPPSFAHALAFFHPAQSTAFSPRQQIKLIETAIFFLPYISIPPRLNPPRATCSSLLILACSSSFRIINLALWSTIRDRFVSPFSSRAKKREREKKTLKIPILAIKQIKKPNSRAWLENSIRFSDPRFALKRGEIHSR